MRMTRAFFFIECLRSISHDQVPDEHEELREIGQGIENTLEVRFDCPMARGAHRLNHKRAIRIAGRLPYDIKDMPILIRADRDIALQVFVDVLDAVKTLGFKRVSLQTEARR